MPDRPHPESQPGRQPAPGEPPPDSGEPPPAREDGATGAHPDPTRYGDWEKNGRCIDF